MNKQRRKQLAEAIELIEQARSIIECAKDEEQEYADNMPESLQESEKHERAEEIAYSLEELLDSLSDAVETIEEAAS